VGGVLGGPAGSPLLARPLALPVVQQVTHLVGLEQPGDAQEVHLLLGADVHLALVDLRDSELDGQQAEDRLHEIGITVNTR